MGKHFCHFSSLKQVENVISMSIRMLTEGIHLYANDIVRVLAMLGALIVWLLPLWLTLSSILEAREEVWINPTASNDDLDGQGEAGLKFCLAS